MKFVSFSVEEGIARMMLNRPPLNILNIEMMEEINETLSGIIPRKDIKVLAICGEGKAFSAGVDVQEHKGDLAEKMIKTFHRMFHLLADIEIPTVALLNGAALGGGFELAAFCDIVLASEKAKIGQPEIQVGVFPPLAAGLFPGIIHRKKAFEFIILGDIFSANQGLEIGLINHVYPKDDFPGESNKFLDKFKNLSAAVLRLTKKPFKTACHPDIISVLNEIEKIYLDELMITEDAEEGINAFIEKRKPVWKDK